MTDASSEKPAGETKPRKRKAISAPELPYRPRDPRGYRPGIGLIGCGGITTWHLTAYRKAGYDVVALCDADPERAERRRDEFYPRALVTDDYREVISCDDVEVVDITTHPPERPPLVEAALRAQKHVLSQKPFVLDLDVGERLANLADKQGVRLAVNQNARWAPHFSYIHAAARTGVLGTIDSVHCDVHFDHSWVRNTPFEQVRHLILYDFAIHWFDFLQTLMGDAPAEQVYATMASTSTQQVVPALMGQAAIRYPSAQATLVFDGHTRFDRLDRTYVSGSGGSIRSCGPDTNDQRLELVTAAGVAKPKITGAWFPDGFHGTMGELLSAIEENREPTNSARDNLASLALCFAAVASAESGKPVVPGTVRRLVGSDWQAEHVGLGPRR